MPCRIPQDRRRRVKVKLELSQETGQIVEDTHVSERTVQRYRNNLRDYGSLTPPRNGPQGRPRVITPEMKEVHCLFPYYTFPQFGDILTIGFA